MCRNSWTAWPRLTPKSVEELTPNLLSLGVIQRVLQNLLRERVSIRDLLTIVETLADYGPITKDPDILTEYVRQKLARSILKQYENAEGVLPLVTLDQQMEDILRDEDSERGSGRLSFPGARVWRRESWSASTRPWNGRSLELPADHPLFTPDPAPFEKIAGPVYSPSGGDLPQ